jgi:hypothetical protein
VYGFETIVDAAVRFDEVETIVNQYPINTLITEKERKDTFTIGTNFAVDGRPPIWEIEFEEEISITANEILKLLREEGRTFLEDNSTLKGIFKNLTQDPAKGMNALTVAYLLKDKDSFDQISREQRILLEGKPDNRYSKFLVLENELRNRFK